MRNPEHAPQDGSMSNPAVFWAGAFTLTEVLVATAVFGLILAMTMQLLNSTLSSTKAVGQRLNASQAARQALDVIAMDIRNSFIDESTSLLVGEHRVADTLAMLTKRRGPKGIESRFLAVRYRLRDQELLRYFGSFGYDETTTLNPGAAATSESVLANGVLAIAVQAVLRDGSLAEAHTGGAGWSTNSYHGQPTPENHLALISCPSAWSNDEPAPCVQALEITIACVDPVGLALLDDQGSAASTAAELTVENPSMAGANHWERVGDELDGIPAPARQAIRIVNMSILLP